MPILTASFLALFLETRVARWWVISWMRSPKITTLTKGCAFAFACSLSGANAGLPLRFALAVRPAAADSNIT